MPISDLKLANLLVESSPDAIIALTPSGNVLFWNNGAESIFGFSKSEASGRPLSDLIVPDDRKKESDDALATTRSLGFMVFETVRKRKDGSLLHVNVSKKVVYNEDGSILCIAAVKKDITRLKSLRDAKTVESRFKDLLDSMPDSIVIVNDTGHIVGINGQALDMFLYRDADLIGRPVEILLPERFRDRHVSHRAQYVTTPRTRPMGPGIELAGRRSDGREFPVEISLSPLRDEGGLLIVSAIRDISGRKQQEEIRRAELEEQNRRVREATRLKSEFLTTMSHELRTPLNGIIGFSEFLLDEKAGSINKKQEDFLNDILSSGKHLLQLINDVLDLAKVEAGRMDLVMETFRVPLAVQEVVSIVAGGARKKQLDLRVEADDSVGNAKLDQRKFKQVLYNLLSNAVKFSHDRGVVRVRVRGVKGGKFRLTVQDEGIGIRQEDLQHLFTEFRQLDSGPGRQYEGTGLGLSLTKRFTELMGGVIEVESTFGKGSSFHVTLPLVLHGEPA